MSPELAEAKRLEAQVETFEYKKTKKPQKNQKTNLKKFLPLIAVFIITGVFSIAVFFFQSFLPVALVARFREEFNSTGVSSILRSDAILDYQLESPDSFYALSNTQREALELNDIAPVDIESPTRATVLVYEAPRNQYTIVAPASISNDSGAVVSAVAENYKPAQKSDTNPKPLEFSGTVLSVEEALNTASFKNLYTVASKQWRGGNAGWYDTFENLNQTRLSLTRTRFASFAAQVLNSGTHDIWKKLAAGEISVSDAGISGFANVADVDADGNEVVTTTSGTMDSSSLNSASTPEQVYNVLNSKVASVLKTVGTVGCAGVEVANSILTVVEAKQTYEYLNFASGTMESFDGQKAGLDGYSEAAEEYLDNLTTHDPETGKTPMEAPGIMEAFDGTEITTDDPDLGTTNLETVLTQIGTLSSNIALTADSFKTCSYIKLAVSGVNFATTILSFVPVLGQGVTVFQLAAKTIARLAIGVAVGTVASFIIPKILDIVVANMTKNVATEWTGIAEGNAFAAGANKRISSNFQIGGGTPASEENYLAYKQERIEVLAREAKTDRALRSPLDVSSPNTFLGSLAYSLVPFAVSSNFSSVVKNVATLSKNSLTTLLPTASAVAETSLITSKGTCPEKESIGAVGDALHCNEYYAEDTSTIRENPEAVISRVAELDASNFKSVNADGTQEINPDSPLGYFVKFCNNRVEPFGRASGTIANEIVQTPNSITANMPLVGDLAQIASAMSELKNAPWISGSACVNSADNERWEEMKWYQRYVGDQRSAEDSGIVAISSVSTFLAQYYNEHPVDNSYEGIIARYSGMTKSDVLATLDVIDGLTFIANYNPSSRRNFSTPTQKLASLADLWQTFAKPLHDIIQDVFTQKTPETTLASAKYIIYDINPYTFATA